MDRNFTFPAEKGVVKGSEYYEVESEDAKIEGCYVKIKFYHESKDSLEDYPIYEQTGGAKNFYYLQIDVNEADAPWLFTDKNGTILYR